MAEKKSEAKSDAKPEGAAEAPKKGGKKFALITVALLAIEGGVLFCRVQHGCAKARGGGLTAAAGSAGRGRGEIRRVERL